MINPEKIPQITGDMDTLAAYAKTVTTTGSHFSQTGSDVNSTWQGLAGFYHAPEQGQLLQATAPVASVAGTVGKNLGTVGNALHRYATTVKPIKTRLEQLKARAGQLVTDINKYKDGGHTTTTLQSYGYGTTGVQTPTTDWHEDKDLVHRNNSLISEVNRAVADWMDAQRMCANAIDAIYGGTIYTANDDGGNRANEFGYSAATLDKAAASGDGLPWGKDEKVDPGTLGDLWNMTKGFFVDGLWGMVTGLGDMVGIGGWDKFKQSWTGIGNLVGIGGWEKFKQSWTGFGKSLLAWDEWSKDPARAFGQVLFNVVTLPIGFTKILKLGKVGEAAGDAARAGEVAGDAGRLSKIAGTIGKGLDKIPTVSDLAKALANKLPDFKLPAGLQPAMDHLGIGHHPGDFHTPPHPLEPTGGTTTHMTTHGHGGGDHLPGHDPFDQLPHDQQVTLVQQVVADSNKNFPFTPENAEAVLRDGPAGTVPHVAGEGTRGADVQFVNDKGEVILQRENKSIGGGYNSFNRALVKAAGAQIDYNGEVWMQVRPGTDVESWIRKWQGVRTDARLADYAHVDVVFRDTHGNALGNYNLGDRLTRP